MAMEELLIIGNGFDLSAGLKTRYQDFFEDRYNSELLEEVKRFLHFGTPQPQKLINLENVNFWDIFFILNYLDSKNKDKSWANIEEDIKFFLTDKSNYEDVQKKNIRIVLKNGPGPGHVNFTKTIDTINLIGQIGKAEFLNLKSLDNFFNSELLIFEEVFAKYIIDQTENNVSYRMLSTEIVSNLVRFTEKTYIFSFNYTEVENSGLLSVENVHGKAAREIIFGIDYKDLDYNSDEYKYSKTYRKLLMNVIDDNHHPLPKQVRKIKFYGHSLSDADYSYFQSIFDFYSIYNSEVIVEFFFNVFDEGNRKKILNNQLLAVTRLFSIYGITMNNKDHGKNLLHKLLLENRIKIIEVDSYGMIR